jgi:hypothetical protein
MVSPVDRFAGFCEQVLILDNGLPMRLEPYQRAMVKPLLEERVRESVIVVPKANAKTTTAAALGLHELVSTPEAEVIVVAASRDQATILLDSVRGFIRRRPTLARHLTVTQRTVAYPRLGGRLRVISSDVNTSDGTQPTTAIVDELHRHRSGELYALLRDGLGKRNGQMVTISTAGVRGESPLWDLRERALALPSARRDGCFVTARSEDGQFVLTEFSVPEDGDVDDMGLVSQANPASWHTVESLRERHDSPSTVASEWRRFACNVWCERAEVEAVIDAMAWQGAIDMRAQPIAPLFFSVDAAMDRSSAAIGVAGFVDDAGEVAFVDITDHAAGLGWAAERVIELCERHGDAAVVVDGGGPAASLIPRLAEFGLTVIEPSTREVAAACTGFADAIADGTLKHGASAPLTASVGGAVRRSLAQSWAFDRRKAISDPSPLMAATLALWGLRVHGPISQRAYDTQFRQRVPA